MMFVIAILATTIAPKESPPPAFPTFEITPIVGGVEVRVDTFRIFGTRAIVNAKKQTIVIEGNPAVAYAQKAGDSSNRITAKRIEINLLKGTARAYGSPP